MRKIVKICAVATAMSAFAVSGSASAATLLFTGGAGGLTAGQSLYANFDGINGSYTTTGTAGITSGTTSGAAEPAFGDQGDRYFYVSGGGTATFTFAGQGVGSFGFDLGSADDYNSVEIFFAGGGSQIFSGAGLNPPGPATGNQNIAATNGRVTIFGNGQAITRARFASGQPSFEFDNIGIGAVPEPTTWALFILGFGVIGTALRRSKPVRTSLRFA